MSPKSIEMLVFYIVCCCSVVTSVTIVESRNYVVTRDETKKVPVPKKPDKTPRFEFYLYNDSGRIIKQYLTIHEIQQILLQQSQNLGKQTYFKSQIVSFIMTF